MSVDQRAKWLLDARFGLFIHWGLYSTLAGEWHGQRMEYIGEWIMSRFRIPGAEYVKQAALFNPTDFNADEWVQLARQAGMRYIVITAKHHEGFAMYHSTCDAFNIVDATPFERDPLKELADACACGGLTLGLYYSQDLDWHEPDGGYPPPGFGSNVGMSWGNDWDFPDNAAKDYARYFEKKVKPQIRELLTQYGPIGLIWFDTPVTISPQQSDELYQLVRELQPDCLVNTRIGNGLGDYGSMGDNQVPDSHVEGAWETPATLNDTWGYKYFDDNWKSARDTLGVLAGLADKNVNYLLNIGPQPDGRFPAASIDILNEIGAWMSVNADAIHGARGNPYPYSFDWGWITTHAATQSQPAMLHLLFKDWPSQPFVLQGLRTRVNRATIHSSAAGEVTLTDLAFSQSITSNDENLTIVLPLQPPGEVVPVITLELDQDATVDERLMTQQGTINVPASYGQVQAFSENAPDIDHTGILIGWLDPLDWISWEIVIPKPGYYSVDVTTSAVHHSAPWKGGHVIRIETDGQGVQSRISADVIDKRPETRCYAQAITHCGDVFFDHAGTQIISLKALAIRPNDGVGLALVGMKLRQSA